MDVGDSDEFEVVSKDEAPASKTGDEDEDDDNEFVMLPVDKKKKKR